jgi:hypothetical protein
MPRILGAIIKRMRAETNAAGCTTTAEVIDDASEDRISLR